tara:strand:- start:31193 stop:31948 length:756 start_codon:yes stop_codon:yes gene_type:complete
MSYAKRLKALGGAWKKDKSAKGGAGISAGKHQYEIVRAVLEESKMSYNKGHMQVTLEIKVVTGSDKGKKGWINTDIEQEATEKWPISGIARFKGYLETLGLDLPPQLSEKAIQEVLALLVGCVFNGATIINAKGYPNHYINDLVHAAGDEDEEEEEEEEDEDDDDSEDSDSDEDDEEADDDDEDEDDDEEEEEDEKDEPVRLKKGAKKDAKKVDFKPTKTKPKPKAEPKKKPAPAKDSDEDDDDWDEDFDD